MSRVAEVVAPRVMDALRAAAAQLEHLGIRHVVVGGLAVGAYGYPRATKDVDFLVGDEAFEHHAGGLVTMRPGVPIQVNGVLIAHLSAQPDESFLTALLPAAGTPLTVAPIELLTYLKLKSPRSKDRADLVELVKAGVDVDRCLRWLKANAPALEPDLEAVIATASREEE